LRIEETLSIFIVYILKHLLIKILYLAINNAFLVKIQQMKHLKGYRKKYFKLSVIAMYSTLHKLCWMDSNYKYYKKAFEYQEYKTSPPQD